MIPRPEDIPSGESALTTDELKVLLAALDIRIPWTKHDWQHGRVVGFIQHAEFSTREDEDPQAVAARRRFESLLLSYGWDVRFDFDAFTATTTVFAFKHPTTMEDTGY